MSQPPCLLARGYQPFPSSVVTTFTQVPLVSIDRRGSPMALSARPIRYIVSGLPTPSSATAGRRPLTPRTATQVRPFRQLLDKQTGALLALPLRQDKFIAGDMGGLYQPCLSLFTQHSGSPTGLVERVERAYPNTWPEKRWA